MPEESESDLSFEQALGQLERIVASLERGEPELTSALAKYETGVQLLKRCYGLLDQAEQSVRSLRGWMMRATRCAVRSTRLPPSSHQRSVSAAP